MSPNPLVETALLVVDVQAGLFSSTPRPFAAELVVERINEVVAIARSAAIPVFFIQHDGTAEENLVPHSDGWKLHPRLAARPDDVFIRKTTCDAFYRTRLESELRSRGVRAIVLTGYATDFCLDSTLRNAVSKDFEVTVVGDAHTTNESAGLKADQIIGHHNYVWAHCTTRVPVQVVSSATIAKSLGRPHSRNR